MTASARRAVSAFVLAVYITGIPPSAVAGRSSQHQPAELQPPDVAWATAGAGWGTPVADSTTAYFLTQAHDVVAVDATTGVERWRASTGQSGDRPFGSRLLLVDALVIAADSVLVAFNRLDGSVRWRFEADDGGTVGPYLGSVEGDVLLCGSSSGRIHAIEASSGLIRWSVQPSPTLPVTTTYQPVASHGMVFAGFTGFYEHKFGGVVALDVKDGSLRWRTAFPPGEGWAGGLVVARQAVIASTTSGDIVSLSIASGEVLWTAGQKFSSVPLPAPDYRPLVTTEELVVAGSLAGHVVAYEVGSGRQRWRASGPHRGSVAMAIVADGRAVFVPYVSGRLLAIEAATGQELWITEKSAGRIVWPPTWHASRLFLSSDSQFMALRR